MCLFLQTLHEFIQAVEWIDVAVADFGVLANVVAAFDVIVLSGAFGFRGEQADVAVAVAERADPFFVAAR